MGVQVRTTLTRANNEPLDGCVGQGHEWLSAKDPAGYAAWKSSQASQSLRGILDKKANLKTEKLSTTASNLNSLGYRYQIQIKMFKRRKVYEELKTAQPLEEHR